MTLVLVLAATSLGLARCPADFGRNELTCNDFDAHVPPGTCLRIANPCDDQEWRTLGEDARDAFVIDTDLAHVDTQLSSDRTTVSICAADDATNASEVVEFRYQVGTPGGIVFGTGHVTLTVSPVLGVTVTASPSTVDAGGSSQLDANPTGGNGVYTYAWTPTTGLDDPTIRNPVATPSASASYTVTVTDGNGLTAMGQVSVTVNAAPLTASFTFTRVLCSSTTPCSNGATSGQEVFLDGSASTGNIASYKWEFDWTPTSPDAVSAGPATSVVLQEGNQRGNIILTVTGDGHTAVVSHRFP